MLILFRDEGGDVAAVRAESIMFDSKDSELYIVTHVGCFSWTASRCLADSCIRAAYADGKVDLLMLGNAHIEEV